MTLKLYRKSKFTLFETLPQIFLFDNGLKHTQRMIVQRKQHKKIPLPTHPPSF